MDHYFKLPFHMKWTDTFPRTFPKVSGSLYYFLNIFYVLRKFPEDIFCKTFTEPEFYSKLAVNSCLNLSDVTASGPRNNGPAINLLGSLIIKSYSHNTFYFKPFIFHITN